MRNPPSSMLMRADRFARTHPWQARLLPLLVWIGFLPLIRLGFQLSPSLGFAGQAAQLALTAALYLRWRRHFPEVSARFHLAALPTALGILVLWIGLGWLCRGSWQASWEALRNGQPAPATGHSPLAALPTDRPLTLGILGLRLLGMTLVVPVIEELFFRSAVPRAIPTLAALQKILAGLPFLERWAAADPATPPATPSLGTWTWTGTLLSASLFTLNHRPTDWAAAFLTGLAWNALTTWCNRARPMGLGPAIWSHALVNAGLWAWCVWRQDWALL